MFDDSEEDKPGIPAWVVTFADLMSLLMCFFVLLLSFSEIDANKFKQLAGELSKAFGVQRDIPALEVPMGTTPIFDRFSPAEPEPTPLDSVRQETTTSEPELDTNTTQSLVEGKIQSLLQQAQQESLQAMEKVLQTELSQNRVHLQQEGRRIVLRIEEKGSFLSGSAEVLPEFEDMLLDMSKVLESIPGTLTIEGHTDDIPIHNARFHSNWDLSAMRASAVANTLLQNPKIEPARIRVQGYADIQPRTPNDSAEARAMNRRVEIIIDLSGPLSEQEIRLRALTEAQLDKLTMESNPGHWPGAGLPPNGPQATEPEDRPEESPGLVW